MNAFAHTTRGPADGVADLGARSTWWLMLARALTAPSSPALADAMRQYLADDLRSVALELDLGEVPAYCARYQSAITDVSADQTLLAIYSRLFITPPVAVDLHIERYLARINGEPSADYLQRMLAFHQVAPAYSPARADHLSVLLEYLAWRSRDSGDQAQPQPDISELRARFLAPALDAMLAAAESAQARFSLPDVYAPLLAMVRLSIHDPQHRLFKAPLQRTTPCTPAAVPSTALRCRRCGTAITSAEDMAVIIDRLHAAGLPTDHLSLCSDCRNRL